MDRQTGAFRRHAARGDDRFARPSLTKEIDLIEDSQSLAISSLGGTWLPLGFSISYQIETSGDASSIRMVANKSNRKYYVSGRTFRVHLSSTNQNFQVETQPLLE